MPYYKRNIYILSVTIFMATLSWNQVVPFLPKFIQQIGGGEHLNYWVGLVFAAQSLAAIVMQPFWGKLGDKYGRKPMIIRAGICLVGVYFGMSLCQAPWQLAICRFLNGALTGFIPGSMALIATNTPEEHAPRYTAVAQTAYNMGLIVGPVAGAILAMQFGYRGSMVVSGTAAAISTLLVWRYVREPNKVYTIEKTSLIEDFGISLRSRLQRSILIVSMLSAIFGAGISPYLVLHLETLGKGQPDWVPAVIFALPAVAFVLTAYQWTRIGERWGYDKTIVLGLINGGIGIFALFFMRDVWMFGLFYFVSGVFVATLGPSVAAITCTRVEESFRGRAYGIQYSAGTMGALIAPLAASSIATYWSHGAIFVFVGSVFIFGGIIFKGMAQRWGK